MILLKNIMNNVMKVNIKTLGQTEKLFIYIYLFHIKSMVIIRLHGKDWQGAVKFFYSGINSQAWDIWRNIMAKSSRHSAFEGL